MLQVERAPRIIEIVAVLKQWRRWIWQPAVSYRLSPRSLALMRMGLGLAIIVDSFEEIRYFGTLLSARGLVTVGHVLGLDSVRWLPSVYLLGLGDNWQYGLLWVQLILGLLLFFGIGGRWTVAIALYFVWSENLRLPYPTGGNVFVTWIGLLLLVLPAFSSKDDRQPPSRWLYFGYVGVVGVMYYFCGANKTGLTWISGEAIHDSLHVDVMVTDVGKRLLDYPQLLRYLSVAVVPFEKWGALGLLVPSPIFQALTVGAFLVFHLCLGLCFHLQTFAILTLALWVGLIPEWSKPGPERLSGAKDRYALGKFAFLILCALVLIADNLRNVTHDAKLLAASKSVSHELGRMGIFSGMIFFAPDPPAFGGWVRFVVTEANGRRRLYDPITSEWIESLEDAVPEDIFASTVHSRRWKGIIWPLHFDRGLQNRFCQFLCDKLATEVSGPFSVEIVDFRTSATSPVAQRVSLRRRDCDGQPGALPKMGRL